jgi:lysophospholipase L1-like esterase
MAKILGFGASVLQGVGASNLGWFDLLKKDIHQSMFSNGGRGEVHSVFNLGIAGNTTQMILDRLENEITARVKPDDEVVFVYSAGLNDSKAVGEPDSFTNTPEIYAENLRKIVKVFHQYGQKILFVGLNPLDETKTTPKGTGSYFWLDRSRLFDKTLRDVASELNIPFVSVFQPMIDSDYMTLLYSDGLHPNDAGHAWIAEHAKPELYKLLDLK